jgi:hypothetical protein
MTAPNPFIKSNQGKREYLRFKFVTKIIIFQYTGYKNILTASWRGGRTTESGGGNTTTNRQFGILP